MTVRPSAACANYAPSAAIRRVHREGVILLGGGRALLMQVAHPRVAAGVAEHSAYRGDRLGRLLRTLRPMLAMAFGSRRQAEAAAAGVRRVHRGVRGAGYSADDPDLMRWVMATLIDSALLVHDRFLYPLPAEEREAHYRDTVRAVELLGLPPEEMPGASAALDEYVRQTVAALEVTPAARRVAAELFAPTGPAGPALAGARWLTAGLLPARLRAGYGLRWGVVDEAVLESVARGSRAVLPRVPLPLRATPAFLLPAADCDESYPRSPGIRRQAPANASTRRPGRHVDARCGGSR